MRGVNLSLVQCMARQIMGVTADEYIAVVVSAGTRREMLTGEKRNLRWECCRN